MQNRTKNAPKGQITFHDEKSNIFAKTSQLKMFVPNFRASEHMKQKVRELKRETGTW